MLMFEQIDALQEELPHLAKPNHNGFVIFIEVTDEDVAQELHMKLKNNDNKPSEMVKKDYGSLEFHCLDPDGYTVLVSGSIK